MTFANKFLPVKLTDPISCCLLNCLQFAIFSEQGESNKWTDVIYPGMIEAIKHVLLVSQDFVDDRKVIDNYFSVLKYRVS